MPDQADEFPEHQDFGENGLREPGALGYEIRVPVDGIQDPDHRTLDFFPEEIPFLLGDFHEESVRDEKQFLGAFLEEELFRFPVFEPDGSEPEDPGPHERIRLGIDGVPGERVGSREFLAFFSPREDERPAGIKKGPFPFFERVGRKPHPHRRAIERGQPEREFFGQEKGFFRKQDIEGALADAFEMPGIAYGQHRCMIFGNSHGKNVEKMARYPVPKPRESGRKPFF